MGPERLADRAADPDPRVERGVGVLEDDLHRSAERAQVRAASIEDAAVLQEDVSARHRHEPHDRAADRRLARSALLDEAQAVRAGGQRQVHAVDGPHLVEAHVEVADLQEGLRPHPANLTPIFGTAATSSFV